MLKKSRPDKCQCHSASIPVVRGEADIHLSRVADLPSGEAPDFADHCYCAHRRATVLPQKIDKNTFSRGQFGCLEKMSPSRWVVSPVVWISRLLCILCSWVKHRRLGRFQLHKAHKRKCSPWNLSSSPSVFQLRKPFWPKECVTWSANHRLAIVGDLPAPHNCQKNGEVGGGHWIGATCTTKKVWTFPPCYYMSFWRIFAEIFWQKLLNKKAAWQVILLETFRSSVNCFKTAS